MSIKIAALFNNPTLTSPQTPLFYFQQLKTAEEIKSLAPILAEWHTIAEQLQQQAEEKRLEESSRYQSACEACEALIREFKQPNHFDERFYVACWDAKKQLQGCMLLTPSYVAGWPYQSYPYLVIDLLLTHPKNISSSLIDLRDRISGIGTALVHQAEEICQQDSADGLILKADQSSIGFYQRFGFEQDGLFMIKQI